ncbi:MAG: enolase C-terminal domain-like protein, partial [Muribaculaceae bacterium]
MMHAAWAKYRLTFKFDARTSRGSMRSKDTYFVRITDDSGRCGLGECALFKGLSHDDHDDYEARLSEACEHIADRSYISPYSSIRFGIDTAIANLANNAEGIVFDNDFGRGKLSIPINGLIWMGDKATMAERIAEKLAAGFKVLKLKIGGINFDEELDLLRLIRSTFPAGTLEIRLDANGSFAPHEAMSKLEQLAAFDIHSIEQPVKPGERLPGNSPIAIALDEELIGIHSTEQKHQMLRSLKPDYIIIKPALCGGLNEASRWADAAEAEGAG